MKKALVLTLAFALGLSLMAFAGPLSGSWSSDITIAPQVPEFTAFGSTIIVDYTVGGWVFESETGFSLSGWSTQAFYADGALGAFTIGSDLVFAPATATFTYWDTVGSVSIAGVSLSGEFLLEAAGSGWAFGAEGLAGDLTLGANVYFNSAPTYSTPAIALVQTDSYCFCFESVAFTASFPFACIDLVDVSLGFSEAGFDGVTFAVSGIEVPGLSLFTFDATLTFDDGIEGKVLTLTPAVTFGTGDCIVLYLGLLGSDDGSSTTGALEITGIEVYAIGLDYSWNGVSFSSISIFDVDKYVLSVDPYWNSEYWEKFSISSSADSCCGGGFSFALDTYFESDSTMLFDWGETDATISYGLGSNFTVSTSLVVDDGGFTEWTLGFEVTW